MSDLIERQAEAIRARHVLKRSASWADTADEYREFWMDDARRSNAVAVEVIDGWIAEAAEKRDAATSRSVSNDWISRIVAYRRVRALLMGEEG